MSDGFPSRWRERVQREVSNLVLFTKPTNVDLCQYADYQAGC